MTLNHQPIGLFDSGVGGLTVLREFDRALPDESVLYFGDTARLPYGTRTAAEIIDFVRDILDWMADRDVKMALMACNTSSALALDVVRAEYDFPILGLIFPGARAAVKAGQRIGVIATPATANSGAYGDAMREIDPDVKVWEVGCPQFVPIVEGDRLDEPTTIAIAREYIEPLCDRQIDTLVYGCTHYPHLAEIIRPIVGDRVTLIDPAAHLVASAQRELDLLGLRATHSRQPTQFYVSGVPSQFAELSSRWLGFRPRVQRVVFPNMIEAQADRLLVNAEE
jgi:glutamate racemase